jgi:hypothetical protein
MKKLFPLDSARSWRVVRLQLDYHGFKLKFPYQRTTHW